MYLQLHQAVCSVYGISAVSFVMFWGMKWIQIQKGAINLPDERFLLTCIKVILLLLVEIHRRR